MIKMEDIGEIKEKLETLKKQCDEVRVRASREPKTNVAIEMLNNIIKSHTGGFSEPRNK